MAEISLEDLGSIEISSVSKRTEALLDAPASIYVIRAEDLRRSGATSIAEALRLAPNLQVARRGASNYAISARGFNNSTGNKLQVLLDGRILYTPLFSGVFWDAQDVQLDDVERIEVISGPGATLWGSNAVNGVINIITRSAADTVGALAGFDSGNDERIHSLRYGVRAGDGSCRIYGKFVERDAMHQADGASRQDNWSSGQIGFRADWGSADAHLTVQGDAYRGATATSLPNDLRISGANLRARWTRQLAPERALQVEAYADSTRRDIPNSIEDNLNTYGFDAHQTYTSASGHALIWGAGYRAADDQVRNAPALALLPSHKHLSWAHLFVQDRIELSDRLQLVAGARVAHNTYTGVEFMPTLRLAWKRRPVQLVWASISRAVRTPSRIDRELFSPEQPPFFLTGGEGFRSEVATVFELGYRTEPNRRTSFAVTAFHHDYQDLRSLERSPQGTIVIGNQMEGTGTGIEGWGNVQVTDRWRLSAGTALLRQNLKLKPGSTDSTGVAAAGNDPRHQWQLRSSLDLGERTAVDAAVRHVGALPNPRVPAYTAIDLRVAWRPRDGVELALTGSNLFDPEHAEFGNAQTASQVGRALLLSGRWAF